MTTLTRSQEDEVFHLIDKAIAQRDEQARLVKTLQEENLYLKKEQELNRLLLESVNKLLKEANNKLLKEANNKLEISELIKPIENPYTEEFMKSMKERIYT